MSDSLGGTVIIVLIVLFITIVSGYLAFNVNYTKAFNRIGLSGFSESDFNQLFDMFDPYNTGIINTLQSV